MKSAISILTYRRVESVKSMLDQVTRLCPGVRIAVFEDCGQVDETEEYLTTDAKFIGRDAGFEADVYTKTLNGVDVTVFLAHENSGVSGNSNKAIRWFMEKTDCDHLCLCNDDLEVTGPFHETYATAHEKLGVGLFCFSDFASEAYRWAPAKVKGINLKLLTRMTGIMMSMSRALVERIGYYDAVLMGKFGEEHCEATNRARIAGFIDLNGIGQHCLDVQCDWLKHQEVPSSMTESEKETLNQEASTRIQIAGSRYGTSDVYRPYSSGGCSRFIGRDGAGIPTDEVRYKRIKECRLEGALPIAPLLTARITP